MIRVGAADIFRIPAGTSTLIYLGLTDPDGVTIEYTPKYYRSMSAQYGETPVGITDVGGTITVKANLLDTSLDRIAQVMPTATVEKTGNTTTAVTFGGNIGMNMTENADKIIIHPIANGMNTDQDYILYKAVNTGTLQITHNNQKDSVIALAYEGVPDMGRPRGDQLYRIGQDKIYDTPVKRLVSLNITPSNPTKVVGETVNFKANAMLEDTTTGNVTTEDVTTQCTWVSSNTAKATIALSGSNAVATAVAAGTTVISCTYANQTNYTTMTVTSA